MQNLNNCGCCEGLSVATPVKIYNRPGLEAIFYRVGNHAQFKESLLARLSTSGLEALRELTSRENDDFTIALLDAWATVSDVLAFYQERIANEAYLGTATEQLSIVELARLIGYELSPGVAASTYLAFTIDETTLSAGQAMVSGTPRAKEIPPPVVIAPGTQVKSVPGPDEAPQTFETAEEIEARAEWNAIRPRLAQPQLTIPDNTVVVLQGADNNLKAGDIVLIEAGLKLKRILKVDINEEAKTTSLCLDASPAFQAFGTPPPYEPDGNIDDFPEKVELDESVVAHILDHTWAEEDLSALIQTQGWEIANLKESLAEALARRAPSEGQVFVFRKRAAVFGYNALKEPTYDGRVPNPPSAWSEWSLSEAQGKMYLDSTYEEILPGSRIAVRKSDDNLADATVYTVDEVDHRSRTAYGLSAKSTLLSLSPSEEWWEAHTDLTAIRSIALYVQSEPLALAESPVKEPVSGETIMLSGLFLGLKTGQPVILSGERHDLEGAFANELKQLKEVLVAGGYTVLVFEKPLAHAYVRDSVTINANVALATHGETVKETLGGGDAAKPFQKFALKQSPLTYTSAATPTGTQSTLEVRANDILWHEVPSFYGRSPGEHIYATRQDSEGKTTVIFGDGKTGARLPSGQENIKAVYRKGIGTGGLLNAHQLSQLITRPLGVKAVTNPLASSGAQDVEALADARRNATLAIFTLDRIVSLQDYEDFARAFAGISKSLATWSWRSQKRSVHLTVAGYGGTEVKPDSELYKNLIDAIHSAGIPEVAVVVESYQARFFQVSAKIQVHPDYLSDKVLAGVEQQLRHQFSFAERAFGQAVGFSEVISAMQNIEGVDAVDIDQFYRTDEPPGLEARLRAEAPRPGTDQPFPAELLTIDPRPLDLKTMP